MAVHMGMIFITHFTAPGHLTPSSKTQTVSLYFKLFLILFSAARVHH